LGDDVNSKPGTSDIAKGALAGAVGGVIGAWAMSSFAGLRSKLTHKGDKLARSELSHLEASRYVNGSNLEMDSIALAADRLDRLTGHRMSPQQKSLTAAGAHFGIGALLGAVYGAAAERAKVVTRGYGVPFATVEAGSGNLAWTAATKSFRQYSAADQAESLIDHAVYGAVLETTRRLLRKAA
jgi:putative membrane protein